MKEKFVNPLREFNEDIISLPFEFPSYLIDVLNEHKIYINESTIELGKKESWIDWPKYLNHNSFYFDFENNESIVKGYFESSKLSSYRFVIMEFGYQAPMSIIPISIFINYWYELVIIAGYESVVLTEDGKLFMEFTRREYLLKSNFLIKPTE